MAIFLCKLENNADFPVRIVTISQFGQGDRIIPPLTSIFTQFRNGRKAFVVWRADAPHDDLLELRTINVKRKSAFKTFRASTAVNVDGTTTSIPVLSDFPLEDEGEAIDADGTDNGGA